MRLFKKNIKTLCKRLAGARNWYIRSTKLFDIVELDMKLKSSFNKLTVKFL